MIYATVVVGLAADPFVQAHLQVAGELAERFERNRNEAALDQLERGAGDVGGGIVVSGACCHSRSRELILEGVTQYLVTQSSRCPLLSH